MGADVGVNILPQSVIIALSALDDQIPFERLHVVEMVLQVVGEYSRVDGDEVTVAASDGGSEEDQKKKKFQSSGL